MRMFDVQRIEITAPPRNVFEFLREPTNLPRWRMPLCWRGMATPASKLPPEPWTSP